MITVEEITQAVEAIINGTRSQFLVDNLDAILPANGETVREQIRLTFINLGVEVEFSGKGLQERGVVIDVDTDRMTELGLNPDTQRFGQTVVKHQQ